MKTNKVVLYYAFSSLKDTIFTYTVGDPQTGRYGKNRNQNRGNKNQKHTPHVNPNKKRFKMKRLMLKQLLDAWKSNELLEIYNDSVKYTFAVGFVICMTDNDMLLNCIDLEGRDDGFVLINITDIYCVKKSTQYLMNIMKLSNNKYPRYCEWYSTNEYVEKFNLFSDFLQESMKNHILSHIKLYNGDDYYGTIEDKDEKDINLKSFNENGEFDGFSFIKIDDIELISFDGVEENRLTKLIK
ncbi:MAG: hypothetical protein LBK03_08490 [Bacteroidales bacterium]|nr:hypothetical protein [Bacteroidales bacterium]